MKLVLILSVVLLGIWLWRTNRESDLKRKQPPRPDAPQPLVMVRCAFCAVHVPAPDALQGKNGQYCCADHRQRAEP